jgi:hypothetical protein
MSELLPKLAAAKSSAVTPPRNYDSTFEKYRGDIPLEYLRALAIVSGDGDFKPNNSTKDSAGMFLISVDTLAAYAKESKRDLKPVDLADVQLSTQVCVWLINKVRKYYSLHYPKSMGENWKNSEYVALITLGYKVGYSENGGLGDAIKVIEALYPEKISIDTVAQVAKERKLATVLYSDKWVQWAKHVTNLYAGSPRETVTPASLSAPQNESRGFGGAAIAALIGVPVLVMMFGKKR